MYTYINLENRLDNLISKENYAGALKVLSILIEMLNINIVNKKFNKNINHMNIYDILELYRLNDKARYSIMTDISYLYEQITKKEISDKNCVLQLRELYKKLK